MGIWARRASDPGYRTCGGHLVSASLSWRLALENEYLLSVFILGLSLAWTSSWSCREGREAEQRSTASAKVLGLGVSPVWRGRESPEGAGSGDDSREMLSANQEGLEGQPR